MSQVSSLSQASGTGLTVRTGFNNLLAALFSQNSGSTAPTPTVPYMLWADTSTSPATLKMRNAADDGWITLGTVKDDLGINRAGEFIATADASSDATIEFSGFDATKYDAYVFELSNIVPATDAAILWIRTSTDGGSTFDSTAGHYSWSRDGNTLGTGIDSGANTDTAIKPTTNIGSDVDESLSGIVWVHGPHLAKYTTVTGNLAYFNSDGNFTTLTFGGQRLSGADVDAMQFLMSTGNIESGTITMYGLRNA